MGSGPGNLPESPHILHADITLNVTLARNPFTASLDGRRQNVTLAPMHVTLGNRRVRPRRHPPR